MILYNFLTLFTVLSKHSMLTQRVPEGICECRNAVRFNICLTLNYVYTDKDSTATEQYFIYWAGASRNSVTIRALFIATPIALRGGTLTLSFNHTGLIDSDISNRSLTFLYLMLIGKKFR